MQLQTADVKHALRLLLLREPTIIAIAKTLAMPWIPLRSAYSSHEESKPSRDDRQKNYRTTLWKRIRTYKLRLNQRCQCCIGGVSEEIHHRNGNAADNRPSNLLALCRACHSWATSSDRVKKGS